MNKKIIFIFTGCFCIVSTLFLTQKQADPAIDFYDVHFLRNSPAVEKVLKAQGFFEVDLRTKDNMTINTIMLDQSKNHNVTTTVISCPGFVPGRKEGMTTLYAMLKDRPYNFMFIDSRGHGKSDGQLLTLQGIAEYGQTQFLDIVAAVEYIASYNNQHDINQNIIIHGLCAGAFHTVKAMVYLKNHNFAAYQCVKGIVIDSGWPSIIDIADTLIDAEAMERCKTYGMPFLQPYLAYMMHTAYNTFFKHEHSLQQPLTEIINNIDQPILFIHAQDDLFVPTHIVQPLIAHTKNATTWFVENSSHVASHLQHKEQYTQQIQQFIQSTL